MEPISGLLLAQALGGGISALGSMGSAASARKASEAQAAAQLKAGKEGAKALKPYQKLLKDPGTIVTNALNTGFQNMPQATAFASKVNASGQSEIARVLERLAPGVMGDIKASFGVAGDLARGQIPDDVAAVVQNAAAERGNRMGFVPGSRAGEALVARDLGLTSLDLTERGANSLQKWLGASRAYLLPDLKTTANYLADPTQFASLANLGANITKDIASLRTGGQLAAADTIASGAGAAATADSAMYASLAKTLASLGGTYFGNQQAEKDRTAYDKSFADAISKAAMIAKPTT
jgi:hypothetical protein